MPMLDTMAIFPFQAEEHSQKSKWEPELGTLIPFLVFVPHTEVLGL